MSLLRPAISVLGLVLLILSLLMLLPLGLALLLGSDNLLAFLYSIGISVGLGSLCLLVGPRDIERILPRQMFLVTGICWLGVSLISALPYVFGEGHMTWVDAIFEAISGVTTTGSTVIFGIEDLSDDLLLWRSMTQWIGGLGIIGMAVAIFPYLRVGGMRLFQTESSDWTVVATGQVRQIAWKIIQIYLSLSAACALTYWLLGMNWFDAINHAMTTVSTGGYSTTDASFGRFSTLPLMWASIVFMLSGALPFMLYFHSLHSRKPLIFQDQQVRGLMLILLFVVIAMMTARLMGGERSDTFVWITHSVFNLVSVITTTGYASQDYTLWGSGAVMIFFCLTFVGSCSGSTSGGVKIFRFQLLAIITREQMIKSVHPVAFVKRQYNNRQVGDGILVSTISYLFLVLVCFTAFSLALSATGLDIVTSLTGAATALANVGPGLGDTIGPAGNFSSLNDVAKLLLCFAMLLGRLEFVTLLIFFSPAFWKW
jgi:trk system potassium uptake protein TrkH